MSVGTATKSLYLWPVHHNGSLIFPRLDSLDSGTRHLYTLTFNKSNEQQKSPLSPKAVVVVVDDYNYLHR